MFSPSLRTHCTKNAACEPWDFFEVLNQTTAALQLRSALLPYIYSAAFAATRTGVALAHPLYYDWPLGPEEAYNVTTEYLFGPDMLVA